jgi:hypothetical protein
MFPVLLAKNCSAAQVFQDAQSRIDSLPTIFTLQLRQVFPGNFSPCRAHSGPQSSW